jgi:succinate-acetate transporter protein
VTVPEPTSPSTTGAHETAGPPHRPGAARMPFGIRVFLVYATLILVGIALSMRTVVDSALGAMPITPLGIVVMILLAYTIFTMTLIVQRKQAGFALAVVLASLTIPLVVLLAVSPVHPAAPVFAAAFGILLFRGLLRPDVRTYLSEP